MTAPAPPPATGRTPHHRSRTRLAIFGTAAVVGLWLGLTAPSASPITPTPPPIATTAPLPGGGR